MKGKQVCQKAWIIAHDIKKESFRRYTSQFQAGVRVVSHGNKLARKSLLPKTIDCIAWLKFFFSSIGDHQPDSKTVHLPSCFSRNDVYKKMFDENQEFGQPTVSMSHFYSLWDKHFSHVLIPKVRTNKIMSLFCFTVCIVACTLWYNNLSYRA